MDDSVSIIVPFFNDNDTINRTISSILCQSYQNFEIIICVDRGSELPMLKSQDPRIVIIQNTLDRGAGLARYSAILFSRYNYLAFIDSDDEWEASKLESQLEHMRETGSEFSFTGYSTQKNGQTIARYVPVGQFTLERFLRKEITICCSSVIFKKSPFLPITPPHLPKRNDYQMWFPILQYLTERRKVMTYLPEVKTVRHLHNSNLTRNKLVLPFYNYKFYKLVLGKHRSAFYYTLLNAFNTFKRVLIRGA